MNRVKLGFSALAIFLLVLSEAACAEWQQVEAFEDGVRVFVDKASVRRSGDTAQVVHLVRWAEPQEEPGQPAYRSTLVRTAYDCVGKREKYLSSVSYAGTMGNGVKVAADGREAETWYSISEASMEEALWKIACISP